MKKGQKKLHRRPRLKRAVSFMADPSERKALEDLKTFFGYKTFHDLIRFMLIITIGDVARMKVNKNWTAKQKRIQHTCIGDMKQLKELIALAELKKMLKEAQDD